MPCLVTIQDQAAQIAQIADISLRGARIVGLGGMAPGTGGTLRCDALAAPLAFTAQRVVDETIHVMFQLDQDGAVALNTKLQEIPSKAAA